MKKLYFSVLRKDIFIKEIFLGPAGY
jgi:hypothetical protein